MMATTIPTATAAASRNIFHHGVWSGLQCSVSSFFFWGGVVFGMIDGFFGDFWASSPDVSCGDTAPMPCCDGFMGFEVSTALLLCTARRSRLRRERARFLSLRVSMGVRYECENIRIQRRPGSEREVRKNYVRSLSGSQAYIPQKVEGRNSKPSQKATSRQELERHVCRRPRPCLRHVWRITLTRQFAVRQPLASDLRHRLSES